MWYSVFIGVAICLSEQMQIILKEKFTMADEKLLSEARTVFDTMCQALDAEGINYDKHVDILSVDVKLNGNDFVITMHMTVDAEDKLIRVSSIVLGVVPEDKRVAVAIAATHVNNKNGSGFFHFHTNRGLVLFKLVSGYAGINLGAELFIEMLIASYLSINDYKDKFYRLANGTITLIQFIEEVNKQSGEGHYNG